MTPKKQRLLIIDANDLTRLGIIAALEKSPQLEVIGDFADKNDALEFLHREQPDMVIMDVMLPDCGGIELCQTIRDSKPSTKLFLISSCTDQECLLKAFSFGVEGYVFKEVTQEELVSSVLQVLSGKTVMAPAVAEQVVEHLREGGKQQQRHRIEALSTQERRVLELVAKGMSNRQVADALKLSEKTIKNYFSSVLSKLSANRRTEAAAMFWEYQNRMVSAG